MCVCVVALYEIMTFQIVRKLFQKVSHRTKKKGMTTTDDVVVLKKKPKKKRERDKKKAKKKDLWMRATCL